MVLTVQANNEFDTHVFKKAGSAFFKKVKDYQAENPNDEIWLKCSAAGVTNSTI